MRRIATIAAAVALAAITGGCLPQGPNLAPWSPPPTPDGSRVVVFGDSLGAFAAQPAKALFAQTSTASVSYNAAGGTEVPDWADAMDNPDINGACVVVELGTNDLSKHLIAVAIDQLHAGLDLLERSGAGPVVFLTLNETGGDLRGWPFDVRTRTYNLELRALAADGRVRLYDWAAESAGHTEWLNLPSDPIHPSAAGVPVYAAAIVAAAGMCDPAPTPTTTTTQDPL